jgi:hypothetical protein
MLLTLVAGCGIGLAGGLLLASRDKSAAADGPSPATGDRRNMATSRLLYAAQAPADTEAECIAWANRALVSDDQIRRLRSKVEALTEQLRADTGEPLPFPEKIEAKYLRDDLVRNFNDAFRHAGVKAEVSMVDCSEYPCIACAELPEPPGEEVDVNRRLAQMKRVSQAPSLAVYDDSEKHGTMFTRRDARGEGKPGAPGMQTTTLCQSMYPKPADAPAADAIKRRLDFRLHELQSGM